MCRFKFMPKMQSKIEKLIAELCPNGVEFKKLGDVCEVLRGKRLTKKELSDNDKYPVFHGGIEPLGYYKRYNRKANATMVINTGSVGEIGYSFVDFWSSDGTFTIKTSQYVDDRFIYFVLKSQESYLKTQKREGGVPTISREAVENLKIPLPPLAVQEEIVKILDNFTALEAELEAELEARKKQYEYYRSTLINSIKGVKQVPLSELAQIYDGTHQTPKYTSEGVPFASVENIKSIYGTKKYISRNDFQKNYKIRPQIGDLFMTRIGVIGACAIVDRDDDLAYYVTLTLIRPNKKQILSHFLRHFIESDTGKRELQKRTLVNAVPIKINLGDIGKIIISVPNIHEQERIASILDKFETLTNDISIGLPAELKARRQQYEYYRGKLLTFNEVG